MADTVDSLSLEICERVIKVYCEDAEAGALLATNYADLQANSATADLNYTIGRDQGSGDFYIHRGKRESLQAKVDGEFLHLFEKEISVQLQELRPDLYFVHSAALEFQGKACMLIGPSKSGKSTTTWALLHQGFRYLSDELAPVDPKTLQVHPYPRSLWLRRVSPGAGHRGRKIQTGWMLCIPTNEFPGGAVDRPIPLDAVFFVRHNPQSPHPSLRTVARSTAIAQILASALNPGAHSGHGLDAAIEIATRAACYQLLTADLDETCAIVKEALVGSL